MGFLGRLLGTEKGIESAGKSIETLTTGAVRGLDALFYTKEESAADAQKNLETKIEMVKLLQDQYAPRAISRRFMAYVFAGNFTIAFLTCIVLAVLGQKEKIGLVVQVTKTFMIGQIIFAIICFYFGYYGFSNIVDNVKKKFKK